MARLEAKENLRKEIPSNISSKDFRVFVKTGNFESDQKNIAFAKKELEKIKRERQTGDVVIDIIPMGKPRMTIGDRWKKRPATTKYWEFKDELVKQCEAKGYTIGGVFSATFVIPMPESWSKKKKQKMNGHYHQQKPDLDNIIKGVKDCLCKDDSFVHTYTNCRKIWGEEGAIIFHQTALAA
jgi:Holliday junction resolvase RusA-like endonuclease